MIGSFRLAELAQSLDLPPPRRDASFTGMSTDSRTLRVGDLFIALSGERFDGHAFVEEAENRGAVALVCQRPVQARIPVLQVEDCMVALGRLALLNRLRFTGRLVALTGSAGKTTTKEMIAAILRTQGPVLATVGNLNNEIGVPLTLLRLDSTERHAVIEMGAAKRGDIRLLAALARPHLALVTNVLPAHLQGFGDMETVADTKGEIYDALSDDGTAVLNIDEPYSGLWRARIGSRRIIGVSARGDPAGDVRASEIVVRNGAASFVLVFAHGRIDVKLRLPGVQQVANAAMAAAVGIAFGVDAGNIRDALQSLTPIAGRMAVTRTARGCVLIDDSYNANPGSVRAAIDSLASFEGTRVLVLGNMAELGAQSRALHCNVGAHARARGIEHLLAVGEHALAVVEGFGAHGQSYPERSALEAACREFDRAGVTMLIKGSRSAGMEAIVAALADQSSNNTRARGH